MDPLIEALEDRNTQEFATGALGEIGEPAVQPLIQAVNDNPDIMAFLAKALGEIGDARAVEPLIQALKDERSEVRSSAAYALRNMGDAEETQP